MAAKRNNSFYRNNAIDAVRKVANDASKDQREAEGIVIIINADKSAQVKVRGSGKLTPATVNRGVDISARDYVLMRKNGQGRWTIYGTYGTPAALGAHQPAGYNATAATNANAIPAVAPGNLAIQGAPNILIITWEPPNTRGDAVYEVDISTASDFSAGLVQYKVSGSTMVIASDPDTTKYVRVRTLSGNWTRSGWTPTASGAATEPTLGTITDVDMPGEFSKDTSTPGVIDFAWNTAAANTFFGNSGGSDTTPAFVEIIPDNIFGFDTAVDARIALVENAHQVKEYRVPFDYTFTGTTLVGDFPAGFEVMEVQTTIIDPFDDPVDADFSLVDTDFTHTAFESVTDNIANFAEADKYIYYVSGAIYPDDRSLQLVWNFDGTSTVGSGTLIITVRFP